MAITLVSDELGDAEVTDNVGLGEVDSAARLWVRHWSAALGAARQYVEPAEVPGLAAEALIGTIAAIAIGRGPREEFATFVTAAVRELGEGDDTAADPSRAALYPEVFGSAMLTRAFSELDAETQSSLRTVARDHAVAEDGARALTVLQHYYLAEHSESAQTAACRRSHIAMMAVVEGSTKVLSGDSWMHLSACAWCTEAFHEVAFTNVELGALIDGAVLDPAPSASIVPVAPAAVVTAAADEPVFEPWAEPVVVPPLPVVAAAPRRRRRGRVLTGAAVAVAAAAVVAAVLTSGADGTSPTAARTTPSETPSTTPSTTPDPSPSTTPHAAVGGPATPGTSVPTAATSQPTPTKSATADPPTSSPTRKPTKNTPVPDPKPTPSSTPAPPSPSPTPTPSATPTKSCNPLQHLFGLC